MSFELAPIPVNVPLLRNRHFKSGRVGLWTALFREGANLAEALGEVHSRHSDDPQIRVISAGCSIGAEVDTVLSLHKQTGREDQRISILGVDINKQAIKAAKIGRYSTGLFVDSDSNFTRPANILRKGGFRFDFKNVNDFTGYFDVDASYVRQESQVSFIKAGISEVSMPPADLVMVNNVLYHLKPEEATKAVNNLATLVASNGILSIGGIRGDGSSYMAGDFTRERMHYRDWLRDTGIMLSTQYGFTPLPVEAASVPFVAEPTIFVRD